MYQGQERLLDVEAESKMDATNHFRDYVINNLDKKGLYGCKIFEMEEDRIRLKKIQEDLEVQEKLHENSPTKKCADCKELKTINNFYSQTFTNAQGIEYESIKPYCKPCGIERSKDWSEKNPERRKELKNSHNSKDTERDKRRISSAARRESGEYAEWQRNNKDKLYEYSQYRRSNKNHDISEQEWLECLDYFNFSCAYCGLTEEEHIERHSQQLHKEHVEHEGVNDITNCVPSCKVCNGGKWESELNEWYNSENSIYSKQRYNRIVKWLMSFSEKI